MEEWTATVTKLDLLFVASSPKTLSFLKRLTVAEAFSKRKSKFKTPFFYFFFTWSSQR